jgi:bacterial/archaeal transporter family-2 protein
MIALIKILPFLLGAASIVQSSLNKAIGETKGLSTACVVNGAVVVCASLLVFIVSYLFPQYFAEVITFNQANKWIFKWWYLIPGLLGFIAIFVIPLEMIKIGALPVFLGVIAGQIVFSLLYDYYFQKTPIETIRIVGAILTFVGAVLVSWKR